MFEQQMLFAYNICSNTNPSCRSLYVPLWVGSIWFMSCVLTVIAAIIQINFRPATAQLIKHLHVVLFLKTGCIYKVYDLYYYLKCTNPHRNTLAGSKWGFLNCVHEQSSRSVMSTADAMRALFAENVNDTWGIQICRVTEVYHVLVNIPYSSTLLPPPHLNHCMVVILTFSQCSGDRDVFSQRRKHSGLNSSCEYTSGI